MATAMRFRLTRIHWLVWGSVCAVLLIWFLYITEVGRHVTGMTGRPADPSRSSLLASPTFVPSSDDNQEGRNCDFYSCFDLSRCIHLSSKDMGVHLYDSQIAGLAAFAQSREHREMMKAVRSSTYSKEAEGPQKACLFIPSLDLLNLQKLTPSTTKEYLQQLPK